MLVMAAVLFSGLGATVGPVEITVNNTVTICEAEDHLNFPWVFRGEDGFMSLSCSTGLHTVTERSMRWMSPDDGATWQKPDTLLVNGMGTLLRDGRAVTLACWGPKANAEGAYPITSLFFDGGGKGALKKVSGLLTMPFVMKPHYHRSLIELPDGALIATIYGTKEGDKKYTSALIKTVDGGKTWHLLSVIAHSEEIGREGFCEPALVRLDNGDLFCALRVGGPLHTTRSTDDGKTWSEPKIVAPHGVDPALVLLSNGILALSYGRPDVSLILSVDGTGEAWTEPYVAYRGPGCHYTSLVEGINGDLLLFFGQSGFNNTPGLGPLNMMRMARISLSRK